MDAQTSPPTVLPLDVEVNWILLKKYGRAVRMEKPLQFSLLIWSVTQVRPGGRADGKWVAFDSYGSAPSHIRCRQWAPKPAFRIGNNPLQRLSWSRDARDILLRSHGEKKEAFTRETETKVQMTKKWRI